MNNLLISLPSFYYFKTRYNNFLLSLLYILKYYGFYYLIIYHYNSTNYELILESILVFFSFYNVYDLFCYLNDQLPPTINYRNEEIPLHRKIIIVLNKKIFYWSKTIYGLFILILIFVNYESIFINTCILLFFTSLTFLVHNNISGLLKGATLFLLYFFKSMILLIPVFEIISLEVFYLYLAASILFNLSYVPKYLFNKVSYLKLKYPGLGNRFYLKAIVLKNAFILPLIIWNTAFFKFLIVIDLLTLIEYGYRKMK